MTEEKTLKYGFPTFHPGSGNFPLMFGRIDERFPTKSASLLTPEKRIIWMEWIRDHFKLENIIPEYRFCFGEWSPKHESMMRMMQSTHGLDHYDGFWSDEEIFMFYEGIYPGKSYHPTLKADLEQCYFNMEEFYSRRKVFEFLVCPFIWEMLFIGDTENKFVVERNESNLLRLFQSHRGHSLSDDEILETVSELQNLIYDYFDESKTPLYLRLLGGKDREIYLMAKHDNIVSLTPEEVGKILKVSPTKVKSILRYVEIESKHMRKAYPSFS